MAASQTMPGTSNLSLYYWLRGEPLQVWDMVEVSQDTTIHMLKELIIKKSPTLSRCDLVSLHVYKVPVDRPVPEDNSVEHNLGSLSISMLGTPLQAGEVLSSIFTSLPEYQLHLIIDASSASPDLAKAVTVHGGYPLHLEFSYWLRGANHENVSLARVANAGHVGDMRCIIWHREKDLTNIDVTCLTLCKISWRDDEQVESLCTTGVGERIGVSSRIRDVFNDVPFNTIPYVVVGRLAEIPRGTRRPYNCSHMDDETIPTVIGPRKVLLPCSRPRGHMHEETIPTTFAKQEEKTPSGAAKPSSSWTRQAEKEKRIPCGRPRSHEETIPPMLLHPVFGEFVDNCKTIKITPDDYTFAIDLTKTMSGLYDNEVARFQVVRGVFQRYGIHFTDSEVNGKFVVDADMSTNGHRYVIAKFKNEVGSMSGEPYFESILHYLESTKKAAVEFPWSTLPCFLLAIVGPNIWFAGATWNLRPSVQVLSRPLAFYFHSSDTENQLTVARYLAAFRKATQTLEEYYDNQLKTDYRATTPAPPHLFPYPTKYKFHDKEIEFHYEREQDEDRLIFFGTERDGDRIDPICIKFVQTYSREAHHYFASLGCAPALRGFEKLPGGWMMVVMDRLSDDFETLSHRKSSLPGSVFDDMLAKLEKFHAAGYVHGDLRDVNIMVSKSDEKRFMIMDFVWAGNKGEARYPGLVSHEGIRRPAAAQFGKEILADHDLFMLDCITRTRSSN